MLYRAERPSSSRLAGRRPWLSKTFFGSLGLVFTVLGGTVFVRTVRNAWLEWHLRQHGVSARGTVTDLRDRNLKVDRVQQWRLHYEYRDVQGHRHVKTFDMPQDEAQQWKVGDVGGVAHGSASTSVASRSASDLEQRRTMSSECLARE